MILAIDQGTTQTTCIVFDQDSQPLGRASREIEQHFPQPGWVEHDAGEIWDSVVTTAEAALRDAAVAPRELEAIGITNQRETVVAWDRQSGEPLHRALVWQDRRTAARCDELRAAGHEDFFRERTGLVLDPYFSGTKFEWLLDNVPGLRARAEEGRAALGTVDAWLIFKLTGEHATDPSNASRTLLYDLHDGGWNDAALELLSVPRGALPELRPSCGVIGVTRPELLDGAAVAVAGVAGDQQAALFGHGCVERGLGKNTYGTGSFVLLNSGSSPPPPAPGLLATVAWGIGDRREFASEAAIFVTGAAVQWLRDGLGIIERAEQTEALAASLDSNDGVYFVPALTGLGSPHWDPYARGTIVGLTRGTGRAQIARATLEAIAYQTVDAVRAMESAGGELMLELRADGGATDNRWLMQFQADVLGAPVVVPEVSEMTALGAAYLAGVGVGSMTLDRVRSSQRVKDSYEPRISSDERERLLADWHRALERSRAWARP
ncbi:MAG TPA: glycerol kinase GlpK [Solirubrobacteraceae bacterium]|nr:glycerol kinase GlpK [Solirubrobacteraceae bacterium]